MTKLVKKIAAMAAAVMMMASISSIGASASILDIDKNYKKDLPFSMACEASLNLQNKTYSVFNLTCCLRNGYKEMGANCRIENLTGRELQRTPAKPIKYPKVGKILHPQLNNLKSYPHKKVFFDSYMLTSNNAPKKKTLYIDLDKRK